MTKLEMLQEIVVLGLSITFNYRIIWIKAKIMNDRIINTSLSLKNKCT